MSNAEVQATAAAVSHAGPRPWLPLIGSTVAATASVLWLVQWLLVLTVLSSVVPESKKVEWPSGPEMALLVTWRAAGPLLAIGLLAATWRYGLRGQSTACWISAGATILVSAAAVFL